jgi:hypothetical protein
MGMPPKKSTRNGRAETTIKDRRKRKTFAITQRGIRNDQDLSAFLVAALSDLDAGRTDVNEMQAMSKLTRQMIALQNLRLKAAISQKKQQGNKFVLASGKELKS